MPKRKTQVEFEKEVTNIAPGYKVLGKYINGHTKIYIQCPKKHILHIAPSSLLSGTKCAYCYGNKKKTNSIFIRDVNKVAPNYRVLGNYINSRTKVLMKCPKGHRFKVTPDHFLSFNVRCPHCSHCYHKTTKDFINEVNRIAPNYKVIGKYINSYTKIRMRCPAGHIYKITPSRFLRGAKCAFCTGYRKNTHLFKYEVKKMISKKFKILDPYINATTKIRIKCPYGHIFKVMPTHFIHRMKQCPYCHPQYRPKTLIQFKKQVKKLPNNKLSVIGNYINTNTRVKMKCNKGHVFMMFPLNCLRGNKCPFCTGTYINTKIFKNKMNKINPTYKIVGKYTGSHNRIKVQCNKGHVFNYIARNLLRGAKCPYCNMSKGEIRINNYLDNYDLNFDYGYITNCKNCDKGFLHFDFWNLNHLIAIEYDGIQHFKPRDFSGKKTWEQTINDFHKLQNRDDYKDAYCALHGIKLIRIKYTDYDNIEKILDQNFKDQLLIKN